MPRSVSGLVSESAVIFSESAVIFRCTSYLYKRVCPSVGPSVGPLVVKMSKIVENGNVGASVLPQLRVLVSESAVIFQC